MMTDDIKLKADVIEELAWDPTVDATHIGVSVHNGVVTLMGHVGTFPQKYAAELAVRRVRGVRAIAQEIEVHLPAHKKHADDEIAERALKLLEWDAEVPGDRVQVKVERGYVTLTGEVGWNHEKAEIERLIRKLSGVTGIRNAIAVKPHVSAGDVRQRIRAALARDAAVEASTVKVATVGSKVVLTGTVQAYSERDAIERAAWSAPGVTGVEDHIDVKR
jgi:osmotically-inducible protein OsmY